MSWYNELEEYMWDYDNSPDIKWFNETWTYCRPHLPFLDYAGHEWRLTHVETDYRVSCGHKFWLCYQLPGIRGERQIYWIPVVLRDTDKWRFLGTSVYSRGHLGYSTFSDSIEFWTKWEEQSSDA